MRVLLSLLVALLYAASCVVVIIFLACGVIIKCGSPVPSAPCAIVFIFVYVRRSLFVVVFRFIGTVNICVFPANSSHELIHRD